MCCTDRVPRALTNSAIVSPRAPTIPCGQPGAQRRQRAATHRHNAALVAFAQHSFARVRVNPASRLRYRASSPPARPRKAAAVTP
jgi:hypothetical protein